MRHYLLHSEQPVPHPNRKDRIQMGWFQGLVGLPFLEFWRSWSLDQLLLRHLPTTREPHHYGPGSLGSSAGQILPRLFVLLGRLREDQVWGGSYITPCVCVFLGTSFCKWRFSFSILLRAFWVCAKGIIAYVYRNEHMWNFRDYKEE